MYTYNITIYLSRSVRIINGGMASAYWAKHMHSFQRKTKSTYNFGVKYRFFRICLMGMDILLGHMSIIACCSCWGCCMLKSTWLFTKSKFWNWNVSFSWFGSEQLRKFGQGDRNGIRNTVRTTVRNAFDVSADGVGNVGVDAPLAEVHILNRPTYLVQERDRVLKAQ